MISDRHMNPAMTDGSLNPYGRAVSAEFYGIVNQIIENLLDFFEICGYQELFSGQDKIKRNLPRCADSLKGCCGIPDYLIDIKDSEVQFALLLVNAVERENTVGQLGQSLSFCQDDAQVFLLHLRRNGSV